MAQVMGRLHEKVAQLADVLTQLAVILHASLSLSLSPSLSPALSISLPLSLIHMSDARGLNPTNDSRTALQLH